MEEKNFSKIGFMFKKFVSGMLVLIWPYDHDLLEECRTKV